MARTLDRGPPASYLTLNAGTPVYTSDDERLGKVTRVLADFDSDVFDGLVVATRDGERFVEASLVPAIYERAVVVAFPAAEASRLPGPPPVPPVVQLPRDELPDPSTPESGEGRLRRAWERVFGRR
jgi:PRC-barrel domain protein